MYLPTNLAKEGEQPTPQYESGYEFQTLFVQLTNTYGGFATNSGAYYVPCDLVVLAPGEVADMDGRIANRRYEHSVVEYVTVA